jgi:hypothetical protein
VVGLGWNCCLSVASFVAAGLGIATTPAGAAGCVNLHLIQLQSADNQP